MWSGFETPRLALQASLCWFLKPEVTYFDERGGWGGVRGGSDLGTEDMHNHPGIWLLVLLAVQSIGVFLMLSIYSEKTQS